jgi:UDP-N-acetylmuramyl tripeptide synthase
MQVIRDGERLFVVDYAHTPDALIQVLTTLKRHVSASALGGLWLAETVIVANAH